VALIYKTLHTRKQSAKISGPLSWDWTDDTTVYILTCYCSTIFRCNAITI